jgi:hypothetical protein
MRGWLYWLSAGFPNRITGFDSQTPLQNKQSVMSMVDGLPWMQEVGGSSPPTLTSYLAR